MHTVASALIALSIVATGCASDVRSSEPARPDDSPPKRDSKETKTVDQVDASTKKPTARTDTPAAAPETERDGGASDDAPEDAPAGLRPRCVQKPTQVMIIGDSYINWITHTFPSDLATAAGQKGFRLEAIGAASMASGGATTLIPKQFELSYARDGDVHTVVMDGGGNDILVPAPRFDPLATCKNDPKSPTLPQCQSIVGEALGTATKLIDRAVEAGIRDVVYFFYPHVPQPTLIGGDAPNAILDYALPMVRDLCDDTVERTNGKLRCHFVDMVPVFEGHADWFFPGDIHPNSKGSRAMAAAVWETMKKNCVGQPASSGCCEP